MLSRSFTEQVKFRWREFRREPSAFYWVVFMHIIWMLALGFAEVYGLGWPADKNVSELSSKISQVLENDSQVRLYKTVEEQKRFLKRTNKCFSFVENDSLRFSYDKVNPTSERAKLYINDLIERSLGRKDLLETKSTFIKDKGLRYVDFLIPGLLGLSIMTSSLFGVGMTIVSNRKENLLKRYLATPMKPYEYILSHIVGRYIAAEFLAVMFTGYQY